MDRGCWGPGERYVGKFRDPVAPALATPGSFPGDRLGHATLGAPGLGSGASGEQPAPSHLRLALWGSLRGPGRPDALLLRHAGRKFRGSLPRLFPLEPWNSTRAPGCLRPPGTLGTLGSQAPSCQVAKLQRGYLSRLWVGVRRGSSPPHPPPCPG